MREPQAPKVIGEPRHSLGAFLDSRCYMAPTNTFTNIRQITTTFISIESFSLSQITASPQPDMHWFSHCARFYQLAKLHWNMQNSDPRSCFLSTMDHGDSNTYDLSVSYLLSRCALELTKSPNSSVNHATSGSTQYPIDPMGSKQTIEYQWMWKFIGWIAVSDRSKLVLNTRQISRK